MFECLLQQLKNTHNLPYFDSHFLTWFFSFLFIQMNMIFIRLGLEEPPTQFNFCFFHYSKMDSNHFSPQRSTHNDIMTKEKKIA